MDQHRRTAILARVAGMFLLAALGGCATYGGCDDDATCPPDDPGTTTSQTDPCVLDPADGEVLDQCGVWVSNSLGDDDNPGTQARPVQTIRNAITLAAVRSKRVYACGETYNGAVPLPGGLALFGGFDCTEGWVYQGATHRAILATKAGEVPLTLLEGDEDSVVGDIIAQAADATTPGGSSIALLVQHGARGAVRRSHILAGNGADGADGDPGAPDAMPAKKGIPGGHGDDACTANQGLGGLAIKNDCGDGTFSIGGQGGDGGELFATDGLNGLVPPDPNQFGQGAGGKGESIEPICTGGAHGAPGADGEHGSPAVGRGRITSEGYIGVPGGDGKPGLPGQGGGGGGASFGKPICGGLLHGGAGGGAGGTGGCGGKPGKGGQPGGSSFGIVALGSGVKFFDILVRSANAGNGGNGGALQLGGQAGLPGLGGLGFGGLNGIHTACPGGAGGHGGDGGNGAGGLGGHSVAVAYVGPEAIDLEAFVPEFGFPGTGGDGGNPEATQIKGANGVAAPFYPFDP